MGKHDQNNTKDGHWPKPVPGRDVRDTPKPKDDGGKHKGGGTPGKDKK
ncbi:MAG: hypothetical protein ACRDSL_24755 [Pseudonocardiaceae bacterium]